METIAIINRKGGVGKTITAQNLGAGLTLRGYSVLFIDMDSQANLTKDTAAQGVTTTALDVLTGKASAYDSIIHTSQGDIIPGTPQLSGADLLINGQGKEYRLVNALQGLEYDFCILDTPPGLNILTTNALTAATGMIIPAQAETHSLEGIGLLYDTIQAVRTHSNPGLQIYGILLTRYKSRSIMVKAMTDNARAIAASIHTIVYDTKIRECIALQESQALHKNIFEYNPRSNGAKDYTAFINEFLQKEGRTNGKKSK